jgi:hypothetical protein
MKRALLIGLAAVLAVAPAAATASESNDGTYAKVETGAREVAKKIGDGLTKLYKDIETGAREVTKKIGDGLRNAWTEVTKK